MQSLRRHCARDILTLLRAGIAFWVHLAPVARRELCRWQRHARAIPDPALRGSSLAKLGDEALNPEAAAFFGIVAPTRTRTRLVQLIVAYQVMYDYLDAVNEEPTSARLLDGLYLHQALVDAVQPSYRESGYYTHHPRGDDGGYLTTLVGTCNTALVAFPSTAAISGSLIVAAERCGEAQARNHAVSADGYQQLIDWSDVQAPSGKYRWWETAAAGISCLAIHALLAAAATPGVKRGQAERIDGAYFPSVCAISALLDSLIDRADDGLTGNHSFATHYVTSRYAAERYTRIITDAKEGFESLPDQQRHRIILAGIVGYYISAVGTGDGLGEQVAFWASKSLSPAIGPILAVMRVRRRQHERR